MKRRLCTTGPLKNALQIHGYVSGNNTNYEVVVTSDNTEWKFALNSVASFAVAIFFNPALCFPLLLPLISERYICA